MSITQSNLKESTACVRPKYIPLGIDAHGAHHLYITTNDRLYAVDPVYGIHHVRLLEEHTLDEYMEAVASCIGWERRDYGVGIVGLLGRALEKQ
jgi:hypothetical protein